MYKRQVFPAFVLGGAGMGLSFVPVTIASLTGVQRADAGVASGLSNTSRQIGGALGLAVVSAIAATSAGNYAASHAVAATSATALNHGFQAALYVLLGLLVAGVVIAATAVRPARAPRAAAEVDAVVLHEAA